MRAFISHSSIDKKFVRTLKDDLQENGIQTWFDEDELDYGDSLMEKLEMAIEQSTHFIIILSPNSVGSDWVKLELTKAKLLKDQTTLKKIIPIKYRECEIPVDISGLLFANLSDEVVIQSDNGRIKFTSDGYPNFFTRLVKTLKSGDKELTADDKVRLRNQVKAIEKKEEVATEKSTKPEITNRNALKLYLKVLRYRNKEQVLVWQKYIKTHTKIDQIKTLDLQNISPLVLPSTLQLYKADFKIGEEIKIQHNLYDYKVHFGGYKVNADTYTIVISGTARQNLHILDKTICLFDFNLTNRHVTIL